MGEYFLVGADLLFLRGVSTEILRPSTHTGKYGTKSSHKSDAQRNNSLEMGKIIDHMGKSSSQIFTEISKKTVGLLHNFSLIKLPMYDTCARMEDNLIGYF